MGSEVVYQINRNDVTSGSPVFKENLNLLPSENECDVMHGKLYTIIFYKQHAFLIEVVFERREINFFDSLEGYIQNAERNNIFKCLKNLLSVKYSIDAWEIFNQESTQQINNDCVVISLVNLQMRLLSLNHLKNVDRNNCREFRYKMIADLINTTQDGRMFLDKCGHATEVIKQVKKRQQVPTTISKMLSKKRKIVDVRKKLTLFEGVEPKGEYVVDM